MRGRRTSQAQTEKMLRVVGKYMAEHEGASASKACAALKFDVNAYYKASSYRRKTEKKVVKRRAKRISKELAAAPTENHTVFLQGDIHSGGKPVMIALISVDQFRELFAKLLGE